jgi:hypothetical protein
MEVGGRDEREEERAPVNESPAFSRLGMGYVVPQRAGACAAPVVFPPVWRALSVLFVKVAGSRCMYYTTDVPGVVATASVTKSATCCVVRLATDPEYAGRLQISRAAAAIEHDEDTPQPLRGPRVEGRALVYLHLTLAVDCGTTLLVDCTNGQDAANSSFPTGNNVTGSTTSG